MLKAEVRVEWPDEVNLQEVIDWVNANCETLANEIAVDAKASTAFQDYKGTPRENAYSRAHWGKKSKHLRKSITVRKSKFPGGGFIVMSNAPHAHLVELGHVLVHGGKRYMGGEEIGTVPAHPFLRPAVDKAWLRVMELFNTKGSE
jgi:hypothetical protein